MKFEIDDKTGMITRMAINLEQYPESLEGWETATPKNLETIDQAVKKTQEKLVNLQIQDSKKEIYGTRAAPKKIRPTLESQKQEKTEQSQKIVDIVKEWAQSEPISEFNGIELTYEQQKTRHDLVSRLRNQILGETGVDMSVSN